MQEFINCFLMILSPLVNGISYFFSLFINSEMEIFGIPFWQIVASFGILGIIVAIIVSVYGGEE